MTTKVRDADLQRDRNELIQFLRDNLTDASDAARFDWLYLNNPNGPALGWLAIDEASGRTVGVAAAFPRAMWLNGRVARAYVLGDFCIAPDCRTLGPALTLQRACLSGLRSEGPAIWFDFPSDRMVAIYQRLGIVSAGDLVRHVKLLRIDSKVRSFVAQQSLASGISAVGNLALRLQGGRQSLPDDLAIGTHEGPFGDEFTELSSRLAVLYPPHGLRSAEYLTWRYRQNPLRKYLVVAARQRNDLVGYAVVAADTGEWRLSDLFADRDVASGMLGYVQGLAQKQKVEKLSALITPGSPIAAHLKDAGFYPREGHPLIVHAGNGGSTPAHKATNWFLMDGDRES